MYTPTPGRGAVRGGSSGFSGMRREGDPCWNEITECLDLTIAEDCNLWVTRRRRFFNYWTLKTVQFTLKTEFNIAQNADTRLWKVGGLFSGVNEQLTSLDTMLKDLRLSDGQLITIEVRNEDGSWPRAGTRGNQDSAATTSASKPKAESAMLENSKEDFEEIRNKLRIKKEEKHEYEKNIKWIELRQEELEQEKKSLELKQEELGMEKKSLLAKMKEANDEIKTLEVDLCSKLDLEPNTTSNKLIAFLTKSIEDKEAALECPVCLETAKAPIFMCQQQHLVCFKCRPKLDSCPVCREAYQGQPRHRYAERDAEELENMLKELANLTV